MRSSPHPEAAFLAAMTASATHEVRNVLAIIKESAGLIQDLAELSNTRGSLDQDKVRRAVDRIEAQVRRGADILTNLNRLAHTLDESTSTVDLTEEVEQLVFLSQRFARKKGLLVEVGSSSGPCLHATDPLLLHMGLFAAMECCVAELPEGARLTVAVQVGPEGKSVEFRGEAEGGGILATTEDPEGWGHLQRLMTRLGSTARRFGEGYGIRILFREGPGES
jgi:signal transduction histidine kinase